MFERYTERARRVLFFARYEASQLGSISIETEHLLLGLIREGKGLTSRILARRHLSLHDIRKDIEGRIVFREKVSTSVEIPFSGETKRVLQAAADEADRLLHNYIGTEHLLLGILREPRSVAAAILAERGVQLEDIRKDVGELSSPEDRDELGGSHARGLYGFPEYLPSDTVHFSISRRDNEMASTGPRHWIAGGTALGRLFARAYSTDEQHVLLPATLASDTLYDAVLVLPTDTAAEEIRRIVQDAIEKQFAVSVSREATSSGEIIVVRPNPS